MNPYAFHILKKHHQHKFVRDKYMEEAQNYNYDEKIKKIIEIIKEHFGIQGNELFKKRRGTKRAVMAIKLISYFLRKEGYTYEYISKLTGKCPSCILRNYDVMVKALNSSKKEYQQLRDAYQQINNKLKALNLIKEEASENIFKKWIKKIISFLYLCFEFNKNK